MTTAILYHDHCPDGWTAAWVACRALEPQRGAVELHAVSYGNPVPPLDGVGEVYLVDFAYPHDTLVRLAEGRRVVVLDHHQSAIDEIVRARGGTPKDDITITLLGDDGSKYGYAAFLDTTRSGAGITWDRFHPREPRPAVVDYVEDRDLWAWRLPRSRDIDAFIRSQPHTLEAWDRLAEMEPQDMAALGRECRLHIEAYCRAAANHAYWCEMGGRRFPIVNITYESCSDVAAHLLDHFGTDMVGYFFERGEGGWQYGFRSRNGVEVNRFAEGFGGGGHPQASGCVLPEPVHVRVETP